MTKQSTVELRAMRCEADRILMKAKPKRFTKRNSFTGVRANRVIPKPELGPPAEPQARVRRCLDATWEVVQGDTVAKAGFSTMASAWSWIDRNETHSLRYTNASAIRAGAYRLTKR